MKPSLFKNLRLQTYLQVVNVVIPLITTPYISRVLGAEMLGVFSSAQSVASFFTLFAMLGTNNYGTRAIASARSKEEQNHLFIEIYLLQLLTTFIASVTYFAYIFVSGNDRLIVSLQLITLIGCLIDISWFYFGIEEFKSTVWFSFIFRVISVVLLFLLVKKPSDLWIYTVIMLVCPVLSQAFLWVKLIRNGVFQVARGPHYNVWRHVVPNVKLFVPLVAMTVYRSTDKAMLGAYSSYQQTGYYYGIDRVINVPYSVFGGISTVILPRMTALANENREKAKTFFFDTLTGIIMLGVATTFGICAVADEFIPLFLGRGYEDCIFLIKIFSPAVIIKSFSNAVRMHYLIPFRREDIYIRATALGATLNVIANYLLIPKYGALGAILATLLSELVSLAIQIVCAYKMSEMIPIAKEFVVYFSIGAIMLFILNRLPYIADSAIVMTIIKIVFGAFVYCLLTLGYWVLAHNAFFDTYVKRRIVFLNDKVRNRL